MSEVSQNPEQEVFTDRYWSDQLPEAYLPIEVNRGVKKTDKILGKKIASICLPGALSGEIKAEELEFGRIIDPNSTDPYALQIEPFSLVMVDMEAYSLRNFEPAWGMSEILLKDDDSFPVNRNYRFGLEPEELIRHHAQRLEGSMNKKEGKYIHDEHLRIPSSIGEMTIPHEYADNKHMRYRRVAGFLIVLPAGKQLDLEPLVASNPYKKPKPHETIEYLDPPLHSLFNRSRVVGLTNYIINPVANIPIGKGRLRSAKIFRNYNLEAYARATYPDIWQEEKPASRWYQPRRRRAVNR